jgi:hypothetical protein
LTPPSSTEVNNEVPRSNFIRIPWKAFGSRLSGGRKESWRGGKKLWYFTIILGMEDEDYKLKKDQGMVETKKEKIEMDEKMKDQDPKSEENEESRLDVKDGWQDGSEDSDDEETLTSPLEGRRKGVEPPPRLRQSARPRTPPLFRTHCPRVRP